VSKVVGPRSQQLSLTGPGVGPCLAVHLSQAPLSPFSWVLRIGVRTQEGGFTLGRAYVIQNNDPTIVADSAYSIPKTNDPAKVVAFAWCPGAIAWTVDARPFLAVEPDDEPDINMAACQIQLTSDHTSCSLDQPGVVSVNSDGRGPTYAPKTIIPPVTEVAELQLSILPAYLWKIEGIGEASEEEPAPPFLQVFDRLGGPLVAGEKPIWTIVGEPIGDGSVVKYSQQWPRGLVARTALRLATSDTYWKLGSSGVFSVSSEIELVPQFEALP
jgi:hypothetical protein